MRHIFREMWCFLLFVLTIPTLYVEYRASRRKTRHNPVTKGQHMDWKHLLMTAAVVIIAVKIERRIPG